MNEDLIRKLKETSQQVRYHIIDMIFKAQSGHPGGSLSIADLMTVLYFNELRLDPENPKWSERDRFVLSKGHACPAWYACLALKGFFPIEELNTLRRVNSILQGHPDMKKTPGIDMTTGSLGIGVSAALGMALRGKMDKASYRVFSIVGDGELNEGIVWETVQAAVKYKLDNFIIIVDANKLQLDGPTSEIMPLNPLPEKFETFGWEAMKIDGHNIGEILQSFEWTKTVHDKPMCIVAHTVKGKGIDFMENQLKWHGKAPNREQYEAAVGQL